MRRYYKQTNEHRNHPRKMHLKPRKENIRLSAISYIFIKGSPVPKQTIKIQRNL